MRKIKRGIACLCVCVLLGTAPGTAYARANTFIANTGAEEVFVVGGLVIGGETALGWALSLLGFTGAAKVIYENRDGWISWCNTQFDRMHNWFSARADDLSVTWEQMQNWLDDIADGAIDTASDCFDCFLDFCTDLANAVNGDGDAVSGSGGLPIETVEGLVVGANPGWSENIRDFHLYDAYLSDWSTYIKKLEDVGVSLDKWPYDYYPDVYDLVASSYNKISSVDWFSAFMYKNKRYGAGTYDVSGHMAYFSGEKAEYERAAYYINSKLGYIQMYSVRNGVMQNVSAYRGLSSDMEWIKTEDEMFISNIPFFTSLDVLQEYLGTGTLDSEQDWACVYGDTLPVGYSFTSAFEMVIGNGLPCDKDVPWDSSSDATGDAIFGDVSDVIVSPPTEDIIDRDGNLDNVRVGGQAVSGEIIIDGVITVPVDGVTLEDVSNPYNVIDGVPAGGVYPIDLVTGMIIGTDIPIEDIPPISIPQPGGDYTISGLDELFPFCIPFDLVDLYSTLKADAEAPKFEFPIPVPKKNGKFDYYYVEIDLSKFNSVAKILRVMELLAFCVGLILVTRNLIRG